MCAGYVDISGVDEVETVEDGIDHVASAKAMNPVAFAIYTKVAYAVSAEDVEVEEQKDEGRRSKDIVEGRHGGGRRAEAVSRPGV